MAAKIHYLQGRPRTIGHFLRVGHSGHRQLETLFESGRFRPARVVIDAAHYDSQLDLIDTLWESGCEIVLDPNVAELSSIGCFSGAARILPWADPDRPLEPRDFRGSRKADVVKHIVEFAIERRVDAILAPAHLLSGARDEWVTIDIRTCETLREELDIAGAHEIAIDYPLITSYTTLRDSAHRRALPVELANLPIDNLWLRISGFGADASGVGVRRYVSTVADFHSLGKPVVADCVGGLTGLAVAAFGAVSSIAHGVAEKERFSAGTWNRPRRSGGGGQNGRLYLPSIDRQLKLPQVEAIMRVRGGRRLLACQDRDCCPLGFDDTVRDPKGHFLTQRRKQLEDLSGTVKDRRAVRFLDHHLTMADRAARQAAKLNVGDASLEKTLRKASLRLDRMRSILEDLDNTLGPDPSRSRSIRTRRTVAARQKLQRS
jgi:hypothetical protein